MEILAKRIRELRTGMKLSQAIVAKMAGTQQTSINRYESNQYDPPLNILIWYADYFDVSLDYLCGRTDKPQGKLYEYEPQALKVKEENKETMEQFINMCFDPQSPVSAKMKEAMMSLLTDKVKGKETERTELSTPVTLRKINGKNPSKDSFVNVTHLPRNTASRLSGTISIVPSLPRPTADRTSSE